VIIYFLWQKS